MSCKNVEIVVAYNTQVAMTKEFLSAMKKTTRSKKLNVTCTLVHGYVGDEEDIKHPFVTQFIKVKNNGFCETINAGLNVVSKDVDYVFCVGNDSFPLENGWLNKLIEAHEETEGAIICPLATAPTEKQMSSHFKVTNEKYHRGDFMPSIAYLIPRRTLDEVGVFDESFTGAGYYADNDYCKRVCNKLGSHSIVTVRGVTLEHRLSVEGKALGTTNHMSMNRKQFEEKWK